MVGRLVLGHTARGERVGWGRQVIIRTAPEGASAGLLGQTPPEISSPFLLLTGKGAAALPGMAQQVKVGEVERDEQLVEVGCEATDAR